MQVSHARLNLVELVFLCCGRYSQIIQIELKINVLLPEGNAQRLPTYSDSPPAHLLTMVHYTGIALL